MMGRETKRYLSRGGLAGVIGGLVLGFELYGLGLFPLSAQGGTVVLSIGRLILFLIFSFALGVGFSALMLRQKSILGEILFWGLIYGIFLWFLGSLTILPLLSGEGLTWDVHSAQRQFPLLFGLVWYGATTALTYSIIQPKSGFQTDQKRVMWSVLVRGIVSGALAGYLLAGILEAGTQIPLITTMMNESPLQTYRSVFILIGVLAGGIYSFLYPSLDDGAGPNLIRGISYGYFWWVAGGHTILPLLNGLGLQWSVLAAKENFASFPGYLLFGALVAFFYHLLNKGGEILFSDIRIDSREEGFGTQGLRAIGHGALAGIIGGLLFTIIMVQVGFLPTAAALVGSSLLITGFIVHLFIAVLIGASYGLLFYRQSFNVSSALGWGVSYGFIWWILGPLTLLPVLLGGSPQWTLTGAVSAFSALIGHLAYGAGLGVMFYWLSTRITPWWIPRSEAEADRIARHKEQLLTSAPALWLLVIVIALTVPVLIGM